ncbi:WD40 repeat-like protein [Aspergillus ellipticus CBS 707.79]|uniref:WD40 repeat-like protein n=1 Tax=Aspergillus ellipticus CBS 707.79 TaxID=1448320 RepID=A0A319CXV4_9EURO|nr:WD40 repeat-like protein [Aspergillus ellipticus CBS 707.79]
MWLRSIIRKGFRKVGNKNHTTARFNDFFHIIQRLKSIVDVPLTNVPQTALPWAVLSSTLEIIFHAGESVNTFYAGTEVVVLRMEWYSTITDRILDESQSSLEKIRGRLENEVLDLYQALLFYQIKSVCFYYRRQVVAVVRAALKFDDWEGDLKAISGLEEALQSRMTQYKFEQVISLVQKLLDTKDDKIVEKHNKCMASLRGIDPQSEMNNILGRKDKLIRKVYEWILDTHEYKSFVSWDDPSASNLLWIKGQAGTGKTMLLMGIIKELTSSLSVGSGDPAVLYFFFPRTNKELDNNTAAIRGLMWLLLRHRPVLMRHLEQEYDSAGEGLFTDQFAFDSLSRIWEKMLKDSNIGQVVFIVDALDECNDTDRVPLMELLGKSLPQAETPSNIKILISSRPESDISMTVPGLFCPHMHSIDLGNRLMASQFDIYITEKKRQLSEKMKNPAHLEKIVAKLRRKASNTFLWVSLVCKELFQSPSYAWESILDEVPRELKKLYEFLLNRLDNPKLDNRVIYCMKVLALTTLAYQPLHMDEVEHLAQLPDQSAAEVIQDCGSFLTILDDMVYFIHQSAHDYLLEHYGQICEEPSEARKIRYACRYAVYHLEESHCMDFEPDKIYAFLCEHFLHWVEAMSLLGNAQNTVEILDALILLVDLWSIATWRLAQTLELQDSASRAAFSPNNKLFAATFEDGQVILWNTETWKRKMEFYTSNDARGIVFSPDNDLVAIHNGRNIEWWDITSTAMATPHLSFKANFIRYSDLICSNNELFASVWKGEVEVRLWKTGAIIHTVKNRPDFSARHVAFSPDGRLLGVCDERGVRLYDTTSWVSKTILEDVSHAVSLAFSPNSLCVAVRFEDDGNAIQLLSTETGREMQIIKGYRSATSILSFSPNGQTLVETSYGNFTRIWDVTQNIPPRGDEQIQHTHVAQVTSMACPLSDLMASGTHNGEIFLWKMRTGKLQQTMKMGDRPITRLAVSPDGQWLAASDGDVYSKPTVSSVYLTNIQTRSTQVYQERMLQSGRTRSFAEPGFLKMLDYDEAEVKVPVEFSNPYTSTTSARIFYHMPSDWISRSDTKENLMWVPLEYGCLHISSCNMDQKTVALGTTSGHVAFVKFQF